MGIRQAQEKRLATDWTSLEFQVRRWLLNAGLSMGEDDVAALAGYLNGLYYNFPATDTKQSGEADATNQVAARRPFVFKAYRLLNFA